MVDEIGRLSNGWFGRIGRNEKAKAQRADGRAEPGADDDPDVAVAGELQALLDRIRNSETTRMSRVHEVLEKLQRGELVTSEAVREAAERILREGL